jgi:nucleoside-diphosphate-sugar epimerase
VRLLITGGAGCLGSAIAREFLPKSQSVAILDNFSTGDKARVPSHPNLQVLEGDVRDVGLVESCFEQFRPTHIVHAAASYADPYDWTGDLETNARGSLNVAQAAEKAGASHLIYLQTALGYGKPTVTPIPLHHSLQPTTSYSISKVAGEYYILGSSVPISISLRIANTCAPHLSIGPLPTFYNKILAGEECKVSPAQRDFLDVQDFLVLLGLIFESTEPENSAFNVSTGVGHSIQEVFEAVKIALDRPDAQAKLIPLGHDDISSVVLDSTITQQRFSWSPQTTLDHMVARQVQWFEQYGVGAVRSHLKAVPAVQKE